MRELIRPLLLVGLALLVPIVPFLGFGPWLEARIEAWLDPPPAPAAVATATVALLSTDVLLPIPSSVVSTVAGAQLGIGLGTLASWLGMMLGAAIGFALSRRWGPALAERLCAPADLARLDALARRHGAWILVATRALPILAEAAVVLLGAMGFSWRRFLPPVAFSSLGIAVVYSAFGRLARAQGELALAIAASIAVPLLATAAARRLLPRAASPSDNDFGG